MEFEDVDLSDGEWVVVSGPEGKFLGKAERAVAISHEPLTLLPAFEFVCDAQIIQTQQGPATAKITMCFLPGVTTHFIPIHIFLGPGVSFYCLKDMHRNDIEEYKRHVKTALLAVAQIRAQRSGLSLPGSLRGTTR